MTESEFKIAVDTAIRQRYRETHYSELVTTLDCNLEWILDRVTVSVIPSSGPLGTHSLIRKALPSDAMGASSTIIPVNLGENGVAAVVDQLFNRY